MTNEETMTTGTILLSDSDKLHGSTPTSFITGSAGTGKTFSIKARCEEDPSYGLLCATTGIASVNLGTVTLNSTLQYFDTDSLADKYLSGRLEMILREIASEYRNLVIDEVSMMAAEQLDIITKAADRINDYDVKTQKKLGIIVTGDFLQLPPVKARWAFEAECWPRYAANTTKLTKYYRQTDATFLDGLKAARAGDGKAAVEYFQACKGIVWTGSLMKNFDGTTIVPKNDQVEKFNDLALRELRTSEITVRSERLGKPRKEWDYIPETLRVKENAYVMILANDRSFSYANGDCGHIRGFGVATVFDKRVGEYEAECFQIELARNGEIVNVPAITRYNEVKEPTKAEREQYHPRYDSDRKRWILGSITYFPLRLAYAATVHKTQGLSLDRVQLDPRDFFMSQPGMAYVALSRVRTPQGLRIVGTPELLARRIKIDPAVSEWAG